jgi:hypothetical protein
MTVTCLPEWVPISYAATDIDRGGENVSFCQAIRNWVQLKWALFRACGWVISEQNYLNTRVDNDIFHFIITVARHFSYHGLQLPWSVTRLWAL